MNLTITSKDKHALKVLGKKLKDTGFAVIQESDIAITIPSIGRKSHAYIKKVAKNLDVELKTQKAVVTQQWK